MIEGVSAGFPEFQEGLARYRMKEYAGAERSLDAAVAQPHNPPAIIKSHAFRAMARSRLNRPGGIRRGLGRSEAGI